MTEPRSLGSLPNGQWECFKAMIFRLGPRCTVVLALNAPTLNPTHAHEPLIRPGRSHLRSCSGFVDTIFAWLFSRVTGVFKKGAPASLRIGEAGRLYPYG